MENSLNLRDLRGKGELELEIPGFDGYTIDTNLVCRSYKRGEVRELKLNARSYCLSLQVKITLSSLPNYYIAPRGA